MKLLVIGLMLFTSAHANSLCGSDQKKVKNLTGKTEYNCISKEINETHKAVLQSNAISENLKQEMSYYDYKTIISERINETPRKFEKNYELEDRTQLLQNRTTEYLSTSK